MNGENNKEKKVGIIKQVSHRRFEGLVVSVLNKTIKVVVGSRKFHRKYHKYYVRRKNYLAHDETNSAKEGDKVLLEECRPLSRFKRWRLVKVL